MQIFLNDPTIHPGAFALVGMGVFYGGIAHVPLSALVLVCELAGNYDLLVPLMLSLGIAFVALRKTALYSAQVATQRHSPVHRDGLLLDIFKTLRVGELMTQGRPYVSFTPETPVAEVVKKVSESTWQDTYPVIDGDGKMVGIVVSSVAGILAAEGADAPWALAADMMQPPVAIGPEDDVRRATELLLANGLRELPVLDAEQRIVGFLDEAEIVNMYLKAARRAESHGGGGTPPFGTVI